MNSKSSGSRCRENRRGAARKNVKRVLDDAEKGPAICLLLRCAKISFEGKTARKHKGGVL